VVDLEGLTVKGSGRRIGTLEPLPTHLKEILDCGGLVPYIKARL